MKVEFLYDGEFIDTGYGFVGNNGIEVCSDRELVEVENYVQNAIEENR